MLDSYIHYAGLHFEEAEGRESVLEVCKSDN